MPHSFPTRRPSDRAKAARQKAQSARREQRRSRSPVLPPAARHGGQRRGRREQQDRRMKRLWQRQPGAERGCEQQEQRQREAMDKAGEGQADTHHVEQPTAGGGARSAQRRVGKEWVRTWRCRWWPNRKKKKTTTQKNTY